MRRIYFLVPSVGLAQSIVNDLLLARIEARHIHIVGRENTPLADLPQAGLAQTSDLVPSLQRGVAAGGLTGLLAGLLATTFPPAGLVLGGGALLGMTAFGVGFGAWMSSMIGVRLPSGRIEKFQKVIADGALLMMIDVPSLRVEEIEALVTNRYAEVELEGADPNTPIFP
jgi:hypothetical protein